MCTTGLLWHAASTPGGGVRPPEENQHPACRLDIAHGDWHAVKQNIEKASRLCEEGGDWERKNRLKVCSDFSTIGTRCGSCAPEKAGAECLQCIGILWLLCAKHGHKPLQHSEEASG